MFNWEPGWRYVIFKKVSGDSALLVLNETSLNSDSALLALNIRNNLKNAPFYLKEWQIKALARTLKIAFYFFLQPRSNRCNENHHSKLYKVIAVDTTLAINPEEQFEFDCLRTEYCRGTEEKIRWATFITIKSIPKSRNNFVRKFNSACKHPLTVPLLTMVLSKIALFVKMSVRDVNILTSLTKTRACFEIPGVL